MGLTCNAADACREPNELASCHGRATAGPRPIDQPQCLLPRRLRTSPRPAQPVPHRQVGERLRLHSRPRSERRNEALVSSCRPAAGFAVFVLPYLGQDDSRLKYLPTGLVTREQAYGPRPTSLR
jgi:hypothetical protein